MRQKIPYLIIGVLLGVIVMQLRVPVAQGSPQQVGRFSQVQANSFVLINDRDEVLGSFYQDSAGGVALNLGRAGAPGQFMVKDKNGEVSVILFHGSDNSVILGIGKLDEPHLSISADTKGAMVSLDAEEKGREILIRAAKHVSDIQVKQAEGAGGIQAMTAGNPGNVAGLMASELSGGSVYTKEDFDTTGELPLLPGTATKPVTWGQIKADPLHGSSGAAKPTIRVAPTDDVERLKDEYRRKLSSLK